MKNKMKILGIIALVALVGLTMVSCIQGGTITVENRSSGTITFAASGAGKTYYDTVAAGSSKKATFDEDGTVAWSYTGYYAGTNSGRITVEGGLNKTITATNR
jgi:hypothetical protein